MAEEKLVERDSQIMPERFREVSYVSHDWSAKAEQGITQKDVLRPGYWAHVAEQLSPYDEIRLRSDDGSFYARLLVMESGRTWARVMVLSWVNLTTTEVSMTQAEIEAEITKFDVRLRGPHKWSVIRKADNAVIAEGIEHKEEAEQKLLAHIQGGA